MKESYREGVANHPGPEPCEGSREAALEALDRGICRLGIELRNRAVQGADGVKQYGRQDEVCGIASAPRPCGVEDPMHAEKLHAREPGDPAATRRGAGREEKAMSYKSSMHGGGESYSGVVLTKQPNKSETTLAEVVEGRPLTKENTRQPNPYRTPCRASGPSGLERVREAVCFDAKYALIRGKNRVR